MSTILAVENIFRNFGGLMAVNGVSLSVAPGERRGIIGPNGAGKTTLFNLISGWLPPSQGRILLEGEDVTGLPPFRLARKGVARTFQRNNLFLGLTVFENVRLAIQHGAGISNRPLTPVRAFHEVNREAEALLQRFGLADPATRPARSLSYGEQRQLEVAIAVATQPRILLLDEPTAGMSPAETAQMVALIGQMPPNLTLLIIEHDMDVVFSLADRITVLHYGEVIAEGAPEEIKGDVRVQEVYLGEG